MRTGVIAVAAACAAAAAPGAAFLHAPSIGRAHGIAPLISLRSSPPRARSAATALRMSGEDDGRRAAKVLEMRRLAEEAAKALAEASLAEEKASAMRRERGQKSMTLNRWKFSKVRGIVHIYAHIHMQWSISIRTYIYTHT